MAVNVTKALLHALDQVRALSNRKHIVLELDCPSALPHIRGNALQLARLLRALLTHAIKVSSRGDVVQVFAVVTLHGVDGTSDAVAVVVADTGAGIQRRGFDRLLGAFGPSNVLQMQRVLRGAQVLSLTCRLGQLEGGRMWVKSMAGHGSILAAVLPVARRRGRVAV
jgi:light-regulated signal transduction histidine kinase (bacteriophytochrome)